MPPRAAIYVQVELLESRVDKAERAINSVSSSESNFNALLDTSYCSPESALVTQRSLFPSCSVARDRDQKTPLK